MTSQLWSALEAVADGWLILIMMIIVSVIGYLTWRFLR